MVQTLESLSQRKPSFPSLSQSEPTVIEVMGFDLGNRFVKAGYRDKFVKYPSYQKRRPVSQDLAVENLPADSWIIQMGAVDYLVGTIANQMQGLPSYQLNKWELCKQLFYGAIGALDLSGEFTIKTLRASTPDTQDANQSSRIKGLEGVHRFSINGKETTLTVERVALFDEGVPAWLNALNKGLWQFPQANNGILDLGGGTAIARLITPQGTVVRGSEIVMTGTSELAEMIQSEIRHTRQGNVILDAIEADSYTLLNGYNFKPSFLTAQEEWLARIRADVKSRWAGYQGQFAQVLVVGGSAPLAVSLVEQSDRYLMAESPQNFALEGLVRAWFKTGQF